MGSYFGSENETKARRRAERVMMGLLLRDLRRKDHLTQQEVAARLGVPQVFVSNYETAERRLDVLELRYVLAVLNISFTDFLALLDAQLAASDR